MIIISNGFNKFHLAVAAAEMQKKGLLSLFITGAYPTQSVRKIMMFPLLHKSPKFKRLIARGEEISDKLIRSLWFSEGVKAVRLLPKRLGSIQASDWMNSFSFQLYSRLAANAVKAVSRRAKIYHYRAGFGGNSVEVAKSLGMLTLCDHSIAHPAVLSHMVNNQGKMLQPGETAQMDRFWTDILTDINRADAVLVNSDFIKETFLHQGWDPKHIHVIYWGVDNQFSEYIPVDNEVNKLSSGAFRLLFAGSFERRKGAESLIKALRKVNNGSWRLEIAGRVDADFHRRHASFFKDTRVKCLGVLSRLELAQCMMAAEVFVFPSLAEGSARVIFEALACGCYVITTPNSGSVVEDGVHGALIPPGDTDALAMAIRRAAQQRERVKEIGYQNAELMRSHYRQVDYGNALVTLYEKLLQEEMRFDYRISNIQSNPVPILISSSMSDSGHSA